METLAYVLVAFRSSEIALLLVALQYAVVAPAWLAVARALPGERRAAGWWAAYAGGSALGLLLIVLGMHEGNALVRALGNISVLTAMLRCSAASGPSPASAAGTGVQAAVLVVTVVLSLLAMDPAWAWVRITVVAGLWAALYLWAGIGARPRRRFPAVQARGAQPARARGGAARAKRRMQCLRQRAAHRHLAAQPAHGTAHRQCLTL